MEEFFIVGKGMSYQYFEYPERACVLNDLWGKLGKPTASGNTYLLQEILRRKVLPFVIILQV